MRELHVDASQAAAHRAAFHNDTVCKSHAVANRAVWADGDVRADDAALA